MNALRFESALLPGVLLLSACFRDDGIVTPRDPPPVLATFVGQGIDDRTSDTSRVHLESKGQRLLDLRTPKIDLVWQFVGPNQFVRAASKSVVGAESPFEFTLELRDPPPREVLGSPDVSIGQFWLYNDANSNGVLDRLIHPGMVPIQAAIDSLYRAALDSIDALLSLGEVRDRPVLWTDTLLIGGHGTVTIRGPDWEETLIDGMKPFHAYANPTTAAIGRIRFLSPHAKWDRFFSLRKRHNEDVVTYRPAAGYVNAMEVRYYRRVFPRPGQERSFERKFRAALEAYWGFIYRTGELHAQAEKAGYKDYPYNREQAPGQDMVVARSRSHFVLYVPSRDLLDTIRAAERSSSFSVRNLDRLATGYNLITCDDHYRCEILPPGAPIRLDLGMTSDFFNPPSSPVEDPVPVPSPGSEPARRQALSSRDLERLSGAYDGWNIGFIRTAAMDGDLWADVPGEGVLRLQAADSLRFLTPLRDMQLEFVLSDDGVASKVFLVRGGKRFVGVRDTAAGPGDLEDRVGRLLAADPPPAGSGPFPGLGDLRFDYGGDTLRFEQRTGDSLRVHLPGMYPQSIEPTGRWAYASRSLDLRLALLLDSADRCRGVQVERNGRRILAPGFAYPAPGPRELFPSLPDTLPDTASAHAGSVPDRDPTLDGKPRFAWAGDSLLPAPDSLFLRAGDGWVHGISSSHPAGFALERGGDGLLLRIPGLAGRAASVTLVLHPERKAGKVRARCRALGGREAGTQGDDLGGEGWIAFDGRPVTVTLGPFPVGADPYFVRFERIPTADREAPFALSAYSVQTTP